MEERSLAHGILFYAASYVNGILLTIGMTTGRWIFVLLILLTLGLTAYMMYIITHNPDHLQKVGTWAETTFYKQLAKVKQFL